VFSGGPRALDGHALQDTPTFRAVVGRPPMALDPNCGAERPKDFIAFSVIARWNVFRPQIEFHLECTAAARCDPLARP
jgi:hypothetical protein